METFLPLYNADEASPKLEKLLEREDRCGNHALKFATLEK